MGKLFWTPRPSQVTSVYEKPNEARVQSPSVLGAVGGELKEL